MTQLTSYCQVCSSPTEIHDFLIGSHTHLVKLPGWPFGVSVSCILFTQKPTYLTPPTNITVLVRTSWTSIHVTVSLHQTTLEYTSTHFLSLLLPAFSPIRTWLLSILWSMLYFFIYFLSPWLRFIEANILIFILNSQVFNTFLNIIVIDSLIVLYHSPNPTNFPVVLYLPFTLVAASPQRKTGKRSKNNIKVKKKKIQIKIMLKSKKKSNKKQQQQ